MFTGLIEKTATTEKFDLTSSGAKITYRAHFEDIKDGASISVNGVCLTVTSSKGDFITSDVMLQTLESTNLKNLKKGDILNLERAMAANSRFDGHIVTGHTDCTGKVLSVKQDGFSKKILIEAPTDLVVKKGSIALNGVSLTVADVFNYGFEVALIPKTQTDTNLDYLKTGDIINIEYDIFAKYVQKFASPKKEITEEFLRENGF